MQMGNTLPNIPSKYAMPLGFRKDGRPFYLIAGGSVDSLEDVVPSTPAPTDAPTPDEVFTKADVEAAIQKARQQEKDKVYGRLENLQSQLAEVNEREVARQAAEAEAQRKADEAARKKAEEELSAKELLSHREQEWAKQFEQSQQTFEQRIQEIEAQREQERLLLEKEREFANLQAYTQRRMAEEADNIAPQLQDFISGNSPDEIENSIATLKAKSQELANAAREAMTTARAQARGVSTFGYAPTGPLEAEGGTRQYSPQDISSMSMEEYAKFRQQVPGLVNASQQNRGLYS